MKQGQPQAISQKAAEKGAPTVQKQEPISTVQKEIESKLMEEDTAMRQLKDQEFEIKKAHEGAE